jgi:hypothetical protein
MDSNATEQPPIGKRFLRTFFIAVGVTALVAVSVNLFAFQYMRREENQSIVQLLSGWGRIYKPILYDDVAPQVAVFGASWARDAFDPTETGRLLGKRVFNHGVSGGTVYETKRFIESAIGNEALETAIINLDSVYRVRDERTKYGFDESLLNFDENGNPNRWVSMSRAYSLAFTGWAIGSNLELLSAVRARDSGKSVDQYIPSYQHADMSTRTGALAQARDRIFPTDEARGAITRPPMSEASTYLEAATEEFDDMVDLLCEHEIDVYTYFTPRHATENRCDASASMELSTLRHLRQKAESCPAKIAYFNFNYPNAVTLEGVVSPVKTSVYYRPDGHPRPNVGLLMAASMFDRDFPAGTPPEVAQDFGADLMTAPDAEGWLKERAARCVGVWTAPAASAEHLGPSIADEP